MEEVIAKMGETLLSAAVKMENLEQDKSKMVVTVESILTRK